MLAYEPGPARCSASYAQPQDERVRLRPYTEAGLGRVPCARCGSPSRFQWSIDVCALRRKIVWVGLCTEHDIELNAQSLEYIRWPDREAAMRDYAVRMRNTRRNP